jgi:hypothetical protein
MLRTQAVQMKSLRATEQLADADSLLYTSHHADAEDYWSVTKILMTISKNID